MKEDKPLCPACGAALLGDGAACPSCGAPVAATSPAPDAPSGVAPAPAVEGSAPAKRGRLGRRKVPAFAPAPKVPAPLLVARAPHGFEPVAAIAIQDKKRLTFRRKKKDAPVAGAVEEERREEDRTPAALYWTILGVSVISLFVAFLFWNSSSFNDAWRLGFLIEMVFFVIIILIVSTRLARKQEWDERARTGVVGLAMGVVRLLAWVWETGKRLVYALTIGLLKRLWKMVQDAKEGATKSVQRAQEGVKRAGENVKRGGSQFREGFHSDAKPNFIVRMVHGVIRLVTRIVMGVIRLVIGVFRLIDWAWKTVVRIGWALYQGIVLPVLLLTWRIARGVLRVAYRVARWALKVSWRIVYWVLRRWPIKYATQAAEPPVRRSVQPKVLLVNVLVSDFLAAPVKPAVRERAEPFVSNWRLHHEAERVAKLMERRDQHESLAQEYLVIPSPEDRRRMREERVRMKRERKAELARLEQEAKEAKKQAKLDAKAAKKEAKLAAKGMSEEDRAALKEAEKKAKEEERARRLAEKERLAAMSPEEKRAALEKRKAERKAAQEAAKAEKLAAKTAEPDQADGPEAAVVTERKAGDRFKDRLRVKQPGESEDVAATRADPEAVATSVPVKTKREKRPTLRARQKELGRKLTPAEKKAFKRRRKLEKVQAKARAEREKKEAKIAEKAAKKAEKASLKETKAAEKAEKKAAKQDEKAAKAEEKTAPEGDTLAPAAASE